MVVFGQIYFNFLKNFTDFFHHLGDHLVRQLFDPKVLLIAHFIFEKAPQVEVRPDQQLSFDPNHHSFAQYYKFIKSIFQVFRPEF